MGKMINTQKIINKCMGKNNGQPIMNSHWIVKIKEDGYSTTQGPFDTKAEAEGKQSLKHGSKGYTVEFFNPRG